MYHILESRKLTESLNSLPTVREIHFDDVIEIRRSIGQGAYVCKLLAQKSYTNEEKNPLAAGFYRIELVRPVTSEEIEKDSSRWNGYKVGDKTNAFYSPEDVIAIAKEVCKARFLGNWKLKIVDYSGKDLDSEILISEL